MRGNSVEIMLPKEWCLNWSPMGWVYVRHDDLFLRKVHVAHYVGPMCLHDHMVPSWPHVCYIFCTHGSLQWAPLHLIKCDGHACWILPLASTYIFESMRKCRACWSIIWHVAHCVGSLTLAHWEILTCGPWCGLSYTMSTAHWELLTCGPLCGISLTLVHWVHWALQT